MTTTTLMKTPREIVAASTSVAAAGTGRAAIDLRTAAGGMLTVKVTNGATGPTVAPTVALSIAHTASATPATGAVGATWKKLRVLSGATITNDAIKEWALPIEQEVMHLQLELTGHTGQAVTWEAFLSEVTSYASS